MSLRPITLSVPREPKRHPIHYVITLIVLNATLGVIRLVESSNRTTSPGYRIAKEVMPMRAWGVLFVVVAVMMVTAYHSRTYSRLGACFGLGLWGFWAALIATSAFVDGRSSYAGAVVYTAGAIRHFQVIRDR